MERSILLSVDGIPKVNLLVERTSKIGEIKELLKPYIKSPDTKIYFFVNSKNKMDVFYTDKYDSLNLESVWNVMDQSRIEIINSNMSPSTSSSKRKNIEKQKLFTGNKDTDFLIMQNLSDEDLKNFCQVNSYAKKLCEDDMFWRSRTLKRFEKLGVSILEKSKEINSKTWKEYYIRLGDFLEDIYSGRARDRKFTKEEKDLQKINFLVESNTESLPRTPSRWIKTDFVNPNKYFEYEFIYETDIPTIIKDIKILLQDPRFRIGLAIEEALRYNLRGKKDDKMIAALDIMSPYYTKNQLLDSFFKIIEKGYTGTLWRINPPVVKYVVKLALKKGATRKEIMDRIEKLKVPEDELVAKNQNNYIKNIKSVL